MLEDFIEHGDGSSFREEWLDKEARTLKVFPNARDGNPAVFQFMDEKDGKGSMMGKTSAIKYN